MIKFILGVITATAIFSLFLSTKTSKQLDQLEYTVYKLSASVQQVQIKMDEIFVAVRDN